MKIKRFKKYILSIMSAFLLVGVGSYDNTFINANAKNKYETIVDDTDDNGEAGFTFEYSKDWKVDTGYSNLFYNGTNHWVKSQNSYAKIKFLGTGIELYGNKQSDNGIYDIYIDEKLVASIDAYSKNRLTKQKIFAKTDLEDKEHVLEVRNSDKKNPASSGVSISIDYAKIFHNEIEATDFTIADNKITLYLNETLKINAITQPSYATEKPKWKSEDEGIVKVDEEGNVTGVSSGTTKIIGTLSNGKTHAVDVEILNTDSNLLAMFGNSNDLYLQEDYSQILNRFKTETTKFNSDFGWKNDEINGLIVFLTRDTAVSNVKIQANDFVNEKGDIFPKENIDIKFQIETSAGEGRGGGIGKGQNMYTSKHHDIPDIIYNSDPVDLETKRVKNAWMNIEIPEDTKPGVYSGNITVTYDGSKPIILNYSFEVLDLVMPEPDEYKKDVELWEYPYAVAKYYNIPDEDLYDERHIQLLRQNLAEYKEMGGSVITTAITEYPWARNNPFDYPSTIKWTRELDGTFTFDYEHFDKWVELNLEYGIDSKLKCFSMVPYWPIRYYDVATGEVVEEDLQKAVGGERWKEVWGQFLESFIPHLDEKGWFDFTYIAADEVGQDKLNHVYNLLQQYTNKDGKHLKISAAVNYGHMTQETMDRLDDISLALKNVGEKEQARALSEDRREKGLSTSFYTCTGNYPNSFTLSDPGESAWTFWYNSATGMDGFLRWAYDNWLQEPYKNLDWHSWESGDTMLVYPEKDRNAKNPKLYSTPRWEKMKEGKRDIEKMFYLMEEFPQLKGEIENALHSVEIAEGAKNSKGGMYAKNQASKDKIDSEVIRMRGVLRDFSNRALELKEADYSEVDNAIKLAESVDRTLYTKESLECLDKAIEAVVYGYNSTKQDEVDAMAKAIHDAIKELKYKEADYSEVDKAIAKANAIDRNLYTADSLSKLDMAIKSVVTGLDITRQSEVDAMANAIYDAYNSLVKIEKPTDPIAPIEPEDKPENPETSDYTNIGFYSMLGLLSMGVIALVVLKKIKSSKNHL